MSNRGIVFTGTGEYIDEIRDGVSRLREIGIELPVTVYVDETDIRIPGVDELESLPDDVAGFSGKIIAMRQSPYDETVFLDSDIYVIDPDGIEELLDLLSNHELAIAADIACRGEYTGRGAPDTETPIAFPVPNTGVVVYRKTEAVEDLLRAWFEYHEEYDDRLSRPPNDQYAFRDALYEGEVDWAVFPHEYNYRVPYVQAVSGDVKILHGRPTNREDVIEAVNARSLAKVRAGVPAYAESSGLLDPGYVSLQMYPRPFRHQIRRLRVAYRQEGFRGCLKTIRDII